MMDFGDRIGLYLMGAKGARWSRAICCGLVLAGSGVTGPPAFAQAGLSPSSWFLQAGAASGTQTLTTGLAWDWDREWEAGGGRLSASLEASMSAWSYRSAHGTGRSQLAQAVLTPVLRYRPSHGTAVWFVDGGIGISVTSSKFANDRKSFSTTFNFGSLIGVGFNFGGRREHEISLRVQHFSNAGIKEPNPGENFLQLRYAYQFR